MIARIFEALLIGFGLIQMPVIAPVAIVEEQEENEAYEWAMYWHEAYQEYESAFDALFNSMEYKRSKNGRSMVRRPGDTTYRFVKGANK